MADPFEELVTRVREHYLEQFWKFVEEQKERCPTGTNELKIQSNGPRETLHRNLYCFDFATNHDGKIGFVELEPDKFLSFEPFVVDYGRMAVRVDELEWDRIIVRHDLGELPPGAIDAWFDRWFGPDDQQTDMIHWLGSNTSEISCDLGTAPEDAFYDLLDLLEGAGVKTVQISSGRAEAEED